MLLSRLCNRALKLVIETNWVQLPLENRVTKCWNYGLQHKNFKICLLRLVWTCSVVNPETGSV